MPTRHLIRGFHGTTLAFAQQIVANQQVKISTNDYDWLGHGAYFFQDGPVRAWKWATQLSKTKNSPPAVVSADLELRGCVDFLDIVNWRFLLLAEQQLRAANALPSQTSPVVRSANGSRCRIVNPNPVAGPVGRNTLDCAVVKLAVHSLRGSGIPVQSVRGAFVEGQQLYDDSYFFDHSHVQIAVLDPTVIVAGSLAIEDRNTLKQAYDLSGMKRVPV